MLSWLKSFRLGYTAEPIPRDRDQPLPIHRIPPFPGQRLDPESEADVLICKHGRERAVLQIPEGLDEERCDHIVCFVPPSTALLVFSSFGAGCIVKLEDFSPWMALPNGVQWDAYDRKTGTLVMLTHERFCLIRPDGRFQVGNQVLSEGGIDECRLEDGIVKATGWNRSRRKAYPFEVRLADGACRGGFHQR
jgi:hypothetical protein